MNNEHIKDENTDDNITTNILKYECDGRMTICHGMGPLNNRFCITPRPTPL